MLNRVIFKCSIHAARHCLVLFLFIAFAAGGCAKKEIIVPSLTPEPTLEQLTGKFVWYDLFTHDMQATRTFYQELFGWTFTDTDLANSRVKTINRDGVPIANAVEIDREKKGGTESVWLGYISVPDVDKAVELIKMHKGTIYSEPKELPDRGRIAVVIDAQGAIFGVVHAPEGDPPDPDNINTFFIGSELWTTDMDRAITLYTELAGYELKIVEAGQDIQYHLLLRDDVPRAGVVKILWDDVKPNWIPYVAVTDVRATIGKAEALNGKLLIKPPKEVRENPLAIIADPSGAVFGIQQIRNLETAGGDRP
jgi:predicted enzyme related to lactoylglutathione lyase